MHHCSPPANTERERVEQRRPRTGARIPLFDADHPCAAVPQAEGARGMPEIGARYAGQALPGAVVR